MHVLEVKVIFLTWYGHSLTLVQGHLDFVIFNILKHLLRNYLAYQSQIAWRYSLEWGNKLNEYMYMEIYMYQGSRSFFDLCPKSLRMKLDLR